MQQEDRAVAGGIEITKDLTIPKLFYSQAKKWR